MGESNGSDGSKSGPVVAASDRKIRHAVRNQCAMRCESVDGTLPPEHPVRSVWAFAESLDLSRWYGAVESRKGRRGAAAFDPRILVCLWLQATLDGVGSARKLEYLCEAHLVYRWICGDAAINHHTLSDFRTSDPQWLDGLLAQSVAALVHAGVADLNELAQDGMRVRAAAGSSSFRRRQSLQECLAAAVAQVELLKDDADGADGGTAESEGADGGAALAVGPKKAGSARSRSDAARERAAQEKSARVKSALDNLLQLEERNADRPPSGQARAPEPRASTTDPEARRMRMADGGSRPAYNVQFATTVKGGVIVGVDVVNEGVDSAQMEPMLDKVEELCGTRPAKLLVDGGFVAREAVERAEASGTQVFAPVQEEEKKAAKGEDPFARRPEDGDGSAAWRARMGTGEGKATYRRRAQTAEWVNAQARNRGLQQFRVRGREKVLSSTLWYALAHNFSRLPSGADAGNP